MNYDSLIETLDSVLSQIEHKHADKLSPYDRRALKARHDRLSLIIEKASRNET